MGRDVLAPEEWEIARPNAILLLEKVNLILTELFPDEEFEVSSGFRPQALNKALPNAAKRSLHMVGKAIDIKDRDGFLRHYLNPKVLEAQADLLRALGLWMEDREFCPTWCHLDIGERLDRPSRVFKI